MFKEKARTAVSFSVRYLSLPAVLLGLWWLLPASPSPVNWTLPLDTGENWFFALKKSFDNYWFPFFPILLAGLQYHLPEWLRAGAYKFICVLPAALAFTAGSQLHSRRAGLLSALITAVFSLFLFQDSLIHYELRLEQLVITVAMLLLVNGAAARFASARARLVLLGVLLSVALYSKGVIALFIPVFLLYETLREGGTPARQLWPAAAVLLGADLAWVLVNLLCGNGFVVLENWYRTGNIALGAMGLVSTIEGDTRVLAGVAPDRSLLLWAAAEVLRHPLRYVLAVGHRLYYLLFTAPLLPGLAAGFGLLLGGVWRLRRLAAVRPLLLLIAYLLLVHLLLPVEGRYFVPMWFLVCTLLGVFLADLSGARASGQDDPGAKKIFLAAAAPVLAFWSFCLLLLVSYPLRSALPHDLAALQARYPRSPLLHHLAARQARDKGDLPGAVQNYLRAYETEKVRWRESEYLNAAFAAGSLSGAAIQNYYRQPFEEDVLTYAALRYAEEGQLAKARAILPCAMQACVNYSGGLRYISGEKDLLLLKKLRQEGARGCVNRLTRILAGIDEKRRGALLARLNRLAPDLWRPEALAAAYEADAASRPDLWNGSAFGSPVSDLKACRGVLPAEEPPADRPADRKTAFFASLLGAFGVEARALAGAAPSAGPMPQVETAAPRTPPALMEACVKLAAAGRKEAALLACQAASGAVDSSTGTVSESLLNLRAEASLQSYKLLNALGRDDEARETLFWAVSTAPGSWTGLAEARRLLGRTAPR